MARDAITIMHEIDFTRKKLYKMYDFMFSEINGKSVYDRFNSDEINPSSREGQRYMKYSMEADMLELKLVQYSQQRMQALKN